MLLITKRNSRILILRKMVEDAIVSMKELLRVDNKHRIMAKA
jgi:hypothetical protein